MKIINQLLLITLMMFANQAIAEILQWKNEVSITRSKNVDFIEFLEKNIGNTVELFFMLDVSVGTESAMEIVESYTSEKNDQTLDLIDSIVENPSVKIPLEGLDSIKFISLNLISPEKFKPSFGGTGVVLFSVTGEFRVVQRVYSGPSIVYELIQTCP